VVFQALKDGGFVSLDGVIVDINNLLELNQGYVPHVVLFICQESSQNVDSEDSKALRSLDAHDGPNTLRKD
jgi:hypothetical protein